MSTSLESWRFVWRNGFGKVLPVDGLCELAQALLRDDKQLIQGSTTTPPPLLCVQDWPVEAADAVAYAGWKGASLGTVGEVEEAFAKACYEADQLLGEPAACRHFLNFWDETPRDAVREQLYPEVLLAIHDRGGHQSDLPRLLVVPRPVSVPAPF